MKAIDTNILARFLLGDDPAQHALARQFLSGPVFIPLTVAIELAWLLGSRYAMPRKDIVAVFDDLAAVPSILFEQANLMTWAVERYAQGADLADMVHVLASRRCEAFVTFEKAMPKQAGSDSPVPVTVLR